MTISEPLHTDRTDPATRELGALLRRLPASIEPDSPPDATVTLPSRPDTVVWGHLPTDQTAVATVASGTRLRIDTVSHQGMLTEHPVAFFGRFGVPEHEVLDDVVEIFEQVTRPPGANGHVLTGPVHVIGAEPGDSLEIRLVAADLRVPYGVNYSAPGVGVLPGLLTEPTTRLVRLDASGERLAFSEGVSIPAAPFPGVMTVALPDGSGFVPSRPPLRCGGNLDLKDLTAGSRLMLPVLREGAGFSIGDPHSAQGDGEVNGTAVEHSSSYTLDLVLYKGIGHRWPVAETPTHFIAMGIDAEVSRALQIALRMTIDLLGGLTNGAISDADAYALCSLAVDFGFAEVVNGNTVVRASIPKDLFDSATSRR